MDFLIIKNLLLEFKQLFKQKSKEFVSFLTIIIRLYNERLDNLEKRVKLIENKNKTSLELEIEHDVEEGFKNNPLLYGIKMFKLIIKLKKESDNQYIDPFERSSFNNNFCPNSDLIRYYLIKLLNSSSEKEALYNLDMISNFMNSSNIIYLTNALFGTVDDSTESILLRYILNFSV